MDDRESFIYDIWNELQNDRAIGMGGVGWIPAISITSYCNHLGLDKESTEFVRGIIRDIQLPFKEIEEGIAKKLRHDK